MMIIKEEKKAVVKAVVKQDGFSKELENTQKMCKLLMQETHYSKIGQVGIFAIIETAKSLDIDPRQALGGGLYFVRGKVEMSARMMNALIRSKKHSITRDGRSNDKICILHGKRADNNDCWTESFSLEEAMKAGLVKAGGPWVNFTRDMLFARALSRLARQLFPDLIGNCYVEGEVSLDPNIIGNEVEEVGEVELIDKPSDQRTEEEVDELLTYLDEVPEYKSDIEAFLARKDIIDYCDMPKEMYKKVLDNAKKKVALLTEGEVVNA